MGGSSERGINGAMLLSKKTVLIEVIILANVFKRDLAGKADRLDDCLLASWKRHPLNPI